MLDPNFKPPLAVVAFGAFGVSVDRSPVMGAVSVVGTRVPAGAADCRRRRLFPIRSWSGLDRDAQIITGAVDGESLSLLASRVVCLRLDSR